MMASTAEFQGNLDQAGNYQQEAIAIHQRLAPGSLLFSYSLLQLGELATDRGDLDRAADYLKRALFIIEKNAPESAMLTACLTSLGTIERQRGDLIDAERYFRRSLSIRQKIKLGSRLAAINGNPGRHHCSHWRRVRRIPAIGAAGTDRDGAQTAGLGHREGSATLVIHFGVLGIDHCHSDSSTVAADLCGGHLYQPWDATE